MVVVDGGDGIVAMFVPVVVVAAVAAAVVVFVITCSRFLLPLSPSL